MKSAQELDYQIPFHLIERGKSPLYKMSINLILVRHAQAEQTTGVQDFDRELTAEGQRDARHIGRWMTAQFQHLDTIISSNAKRAMNTAEIITEEFRQNHVIKPSEEVYEASVRTLLETVNAVDPKFQNILLVGHNPSISYLAEYLTGSPLNGMAPGSAAVISFENLKWSEVSEKSGTLVTYQMPANL